MPLFRGGVVANREPGSYIYIYIYIHFFFRMQIDFFLNLFNPRLKIADFPKDFLKKGISDFHFSDFSLGKKKASKNKIPGHRNKSLKL